MKFKAAIFDLDGTLLDTLEDIADSANRVLTRRGFPPHDLNVYRRFVGEGVTVLMTRAVPPPYRSDPSLIQKCVEEFREDYGRNWKTKTRPYEGVMEMLGTLAARGVKLGVLSNKPDDSTRVCVDELLPGIPFEAVMGQREGIPAKPAPDGALELARIMGTSPEHILYAGDTPIDMRTALAAGMFAVGVLWGFRPREELESAGAHMLIAHPREILALLE
jgi:phosphoglycolate phosphatase